MQLQTRHVRLIGFVGGVLFLLHALLPASYLFPLVWPLFSGSLAAVVHARHRESNGWRWRLWLALKAGAVAGVTFFVLGIGFLYLEGRLPWLETLRASSLGARWSPDKALVVNSAIMAIGAIPLAAVVGGVLVLPFHRTSRRSRA